jgi:anhydro-N-acetylmuramic acid kinase
MSELYIGVMSGTSLDGVDVCLCEIDKFTCKLISFKEYPFEPSLKSDILQTIESDVSIKKIGELEHRLGHLFADAINSMIRQEHIDTKILKAIGVHGQTLWHQPEGKYPFSMQLGDANIISYKTGIKTVADFRRADMARGGQGAPFAPVFHQFLYAKREKTAVLNIGGVANISVLGENLIGYDTGCGNVLMDYWISKKKNEPFDRDGLWAKSGKCNTKLLKKMLQDDYFKKSYPKSTGRELFSAKWLESKLEGFDIKAEDVQATLINLSVRSIADELKRFDIKELIICGGGGKNIYLLELLQSALSGVKIEVAKEGDALEAMMIAWLAYKRIHRQKVSLKSVTGALKDSILGAVYG